MDDRPSLAYLTDRRAAIERRLASSVETVEPEGLAAPMRHALLSGGKRVRPTLTLLTCEAVGGNREDALEFAVGIELVHTASLVVDDVIDRSRLRRGTESTWAAFDHSDALIGSDGLIAEAFARFQTNPQAMAIVADALVELGEGEASELVDQPTTEAEYVELARRKTGVLFRAAAEVGVIAGNGPQSAINGLGTYAEHVGVAFQIRDDVLDATSDSETLGKPSGRDDAMDRPSLLAIEDVTPSTANAYAEDQADAALDALAGVDLVDDEIETYLEELADFVVTRTR